MHFGPALAETYLSWLPALSPSGFAAMIAVSAVLWCLLRTFWGSSQVHGRVGLWILRGCSVAILLAILFGPTIVDEQSGDVKRPTLHYLFDASTSMQLGQRETRWQQSLRFVNDSERQAGLDHVADCQAFRFGHRLLPLTNAPDDSNAAKNSETDGSLTQPSLASVETVMRSARPEIDPPTATDSRLGDALRQLLPQVDAQSSAGVVLLSDGRVRAPDSVEQLAEVFGKSKVPIHVVPIGRATGTGDVAVISIVVPPRVRKYTENEVQVFLRSFGFSGQRTAVRVLSRSRTGGSGPATLASVPVTLSGGAQSLSLRFRVNEQPEDLEIVVDPIDGELTERNNRVTARVDIDRTKIRVLYIESDISPNQQHSGTGRPSSLGLNSNSTAPTIASNVHEALRADEDIEVTVLASVGGAAPRNININRSTSTVGFPNSRAELLAYDCVILSNVGPDVLEEQQVERLGRWIEGGGGLVVAGGAALKRDQWRESPLAPLLPIGLEDGQPTSAEAIAVDISLPQHPIWLLRLEQALNQKLLSDLPPLRIQGTAYRPKSTAQVLATRRDDGTAVLAAHRVGRGRVLVSTAAIGGRSIAGMADSWGPRSEQVAAKFWRNLVYWVTEGSSTGRRRLVAESDKRFYRPGDALTVLATAYDEDSQRTRKYRLWAMLEPASLDDMSLYSPVLWPNNVVRESGEAGPRIAWGEEWPLSENPNGDGYLMDLMLSESSGVADGGLQIQITAYEGEESASTFGHGTQVDSTSLGIQLLNDPFEQQNPLPNHELLTRLADASGGQVLNNPAELADQLKSRATVLGPPRREMTPAWNAWWLWTCLIGLLSSEWIWRRVTGLA